MKPFKTAVLAAVLSTLSVTSAVADSTYYCVGSVKSLMISPSGIVTATVGTITSAYFCQIGATVNGVTSDACKAIHAQLLAATVSNRQVRMYFNDSLSCTTHPAWSTLTGWYAGPEFVQ